MGQKLLSANRFWRLLAATICLLVILPASAALAVSISKVFNTTEQGLKTNMIAALVSNTTDDNQIVERASSTNKGKTVGIVTTIDSNLLTLTNSEAKVNVTTSGDAEMYATDL